MLALAALPVGDQRCLATLPSPHRAHKKDVQGSMPRFSRGTAKGTKLHQPQPPKAATPIPTPNNTFKTYDFNKHWVNMRAWTHQRPQRQSGRIVGGSKGAYNVNRQFSSKSKEHIHRYTHYATSFGTPRQPPTLKTILCCEYDTQNSNVNIKQLPCYRIHRQTLTNLHPAPSLKC